MDVVICKPVRTPLWNGSGDSLGHLIGATGGQGLAAVFEAIR